MGRSGWGDASGERGTAAKPVFEILGSMGGGVSSGGDSRMMIGEGTSQARDDGQTTGEDISQADEIAGEEASRTDTAMPLCNEDGRERRKRRRIDAL